MTFAARLAPWAAKLWGKGIALRVQIYFRHDHTVRQRQGLGESLCEHALLCEGEIRIPCLDGIQIEAHLMSPPRRRRH